MQKFLNKSYPFDFSLRKRVGIAAWISIGIFLFILFFQPFNIVQDDLNNYILLVAGFGGITFLFQNLVHTTIPLGSISFRLDRYNLNILLVFELVIWILNSVAFSFYLRYVAGVQLTMFLTFRAVMVALIPPVINMLIYEIYDLKLQMSNAEIRTGEDLMAEEEREKKRFIEFTPATGSDKLALNINDLILVKSAENYVEIHYRDKNEVQRKLLRNTLRNIEYQLRVYPFIVRCHRNCIINISHAEKLKRTPDGFRLLVKEYDEIAVSRQYLLQVKSALENRV